MPRADGLAEEFDADPEAVPIAVDIVEVVAPPDEIAMLRATIATMAARIAELEAPPPENWLPLKPAAFETSLGYERLRSWCEHGLVKFMRIGGRLFVDTVSVQETKHRRGIR
jgi:hypothetical protein